jgi:hypothetical protein
MLVVFDEGSLQDDAEAARVESDAILCTYTENHHLVSASEHPIRAMGQSIWKRIQQVLRGHANLLRFI